VNTDSKTKILIVDDDRKLLRQVRTHLEDLQYDVTTAEDGLAGLALVHSMAPDLVVLDINFSDSKCTRNPSIDGLEVLRRLRESGKLPVIMLSSTNNSAMKVMALSIGADDYLSKPSETLELGVRIGLILQKCRMSTATEAATREQMSYRDRHAS